MEKKWQILLTNIFGILFGYFLYQESALQREQILLYSGLRILGINFLFFSNRFIRIFSLPGIIGIGFLLILGFFPLYDQSPDGKNFSLTQGISYLYIGESNMSEIIEESNQSQQKIIPKENNQRLLFTESPSRMIFLNQNKQSSGIQSQLLISFPDNTVLLIHPSSQIKIEKNNTIYTIAKEFGSVELYQPTNNHTTLIKNIDSQEQKNKSDFSIPYIIQDYERRQKQYVINQGGGIIITRPPYQKFSQQILEIAYTIRPNIYKTNRENYNQYKQILGRNESKKTYTSTGNWREPITSQFKKGVAETRNFN